MEKPGDQDHLAIQLQAMANNRAAHSSRAWALQRRGVVQTMASNIQARIRKIQQELEKLKLMCPCYVRVLFCFVFLLLLSISHAFVWLSG